MTQTYVLPAQKRSTAFLRPHRGNLANLVALLMEEKPTPQLPLDFYSGPPDPGDRFFMAFTLDTPEEHAAGVFARRYGRPPEFVFESRGNLLCGPIPEVTP